MTGSGRMDQSSSKRSLTLRVGRWTKCLQECPTRRVRLRSVFLEASAWRRPTHRLLAPRNFGPGRIVLGADFQIVIVEMRILEFLVLGRRVRVRLDRFIAHGSHPP